MAYLQNLHREHLVNGQIGTVTKFLTAREAVSRGIEIGFSRTDDGLTGSPPIAENNGIQATNAPDAPLTRYDYSGIPSYILEAQTMWPVVHFPKGSKSYTAIDVLCVPDTWLVYDERSRIKMGTREQVNQCLTLRFKHALIIINFKSRYL